MKDSYCLLFRRYFPTKMKTIFFFFYGGSLMDVASQTAWRNYPLSSACLPASTVEAPIHSRMSCVHLFLGLPLPLLPSHVPSKNSFSNHPMCYAVKCGQSMIIFVSWLGSKVVGLLSLAVQGHWHLSFSQSMKFWVSSGSISSWKKLSFSRRSLSWSKPCSHRLQQEKCRPLRFSIGAQLTATSIEVPLCSI